MLLLTLAVRGVVRGQRNAVAQVRRGGERHARAVVAALLRLLQFLSSALPLKRGRLSSLVAVAVYLRRPQPLINTPLLRRVAIN